jgi:hypothetical protein
MLGDGPGVIAVKNATFGAIVTGTLNNNAAIPAAQRDFMKSTRVNDPGGILAGAAGTLTAHGITLHNDVVGGTGINNAWNVLQLNCALQYYQTANINLGTGNNLLGVDGAETLLGFGDGAVSFEYPEDIEIFGASFNTTIWGWGVQGDFTYRPNAPFQVDTDSLTINALVASCTFHQIAGAAAVSNVQPFATPDGSGRKAVCGNESRQNPVIRNEMVTGQIGTTATFTASEWWVDALGGDLALLVTEAGFVFVPDVEETWFQKYNAASSRNLANINVAQYQNIGCQGTELPLGGILDLDFKNSKQCRPNDLSAGLVMLMRMEYNNAFDTGFVVTPQIVYSYDFEGTTPSPYGNYLEDRQSLGLSVTGTLNNNFRLGASYSAFFGGHIANKARDQDFASVTASYTF